MDRKLLMMLIERFDGGPAGLDNLAAAIGETRDTIEDVIEPSLIQPGYLMRTPRGRIAGKLAYQHYGLKVPERLAASEEHTSDLQSPMRIPHAVFCLQTTTAVHPTDQ